MPKVLECENCGIQTRSRTARFCDACRPLPRPPRGPITEADYLVEDRGYVTACWIWKGRNPTNPHYGKIRTAEGVRASHVISYQQFIGSVPEGLQVDHLCSIKRCINPSHLEAVTPAENVRRSRAARLNSEVVAKIRSSTIASNDLARLYDVHPETIRYVRRGKTWKGV